MLPATFAKFLQITPDEVERLLSMSADMIYDDPLYNRLVGNIDAQTLERSAQQVRSIYENNLEEVKHRYDLGNTIMSGYTLVNWVLGFMMYPERMRDMLSVHGNVPANVVADVLPELLDLLDQVSDGAEWKYALLTFSLPLLAAR